MYLCEVVSPWQTAGGVNQMAVAVAWPAEWTDVTGQDRVPPDPNLLVAYGRVSEVQMTALLADARFAVLWHEPEVANG